MATDIAPGETFGDGVLPDTRHTQDDEEPPQSAARFAALTDAIREQWQGMDREERAFLVYCLQRLQTQWRGMMPDDASQRGDDPQDSPMRTT